MLYCLHSRLFFQPNFVLVYIVVVIAYLVSVPHLVCQFWIVVKDDKDFVFAHFIKHVCDVVQTLCEGFFVLAKRRCVLSQTFCV